MSLILPLIFCILAAYLLRKAARKLSIPEVVALLSLGLFFTNQEIHELLVAENSFYFKILSDLGILSLMFVAGLRSSQRRILKEAKEGLILAITAWLIPFSLGFGVLFLCGFDFSAALVAGVCLSISAEATTTKFLLDINKLNTRVGALLIDAGIFDDLLGVIALLIISGIYAESSSGELSLLMLSIGAFVLGIYLHRKLKVQRINKIEDYLNLSFIPFFFIYLGFNIHISFTDNVILILGIVALAFLGKMGGSLLFKCWSNFSWKQLQLIGWGLNSRGAIELIIAAIALQLNLIDGTLYSALVITALVTTLVFPFAMKLLLNKNPKLMD